MLSANFKKKDLEPLGYPSQDEAKKRPLTESERALRKAIDKQNRFFTSKMARK